MKHLKDLYVLAPVGVKAALAALALTVTFSLGLYVGGNYFFSEHVENYNFPPPSAPQLDNREVVIPAFALATGPAVVIIFRCVSDPGEGRRTKRQRGAGR